MLVTDSVAGRETWRPSPFATAVRCGPGRVLLRAGEPAHTVYLIRRGQARTFVLSSDGRETTTSVVGAGQLLGISPLLGQATYHEFVESLEPLELWGFPAQRLLDALSSNRELLGLVIGALAQRLAQEVTLLADVALSSAPERASDVAALLQRQLGETPRLNKRSFSDLIGVRPETLSRVAHRRPRAVRTPQAATARGGSVATAAALRFEPGEEIPVVGEHVYIVHHGLVELSLTDGRNRRIVIDHLTAGCFGLPPLAGRMTAHARTAVILDALSPGDLLTLFDARPDLCCQVVSQTAARLNRIEHLLHRAHAPTAKARVASLVLDLARSEGQPCPDGSVVLSTVWTHAALAQAVGARRETVTRALRELTVQGYIRRTGHHLQVCDPRRLARVVPC